MTRLVQCKKLKQEAIGLAQPPIPGDLGKKIYEEISETAWQMWLKHQVMLINEYRLSMIDLEARKFLMKEMENFLFGSTYHQPVGYIPPR